MINKVDEGVVVGPFLSHIMSTRRSFVYIISIVKCLSFSGRSSGHTTWSA